MKNTKTYLIVVIALVVGIVLGNLFSSPKQKKQKKTLTEKAKKTKKQDTVQYWTCAMHPQIKESKPGNCPICGMKLVPVKKEKTANDKVVAFTNGAIALAGIETSVVKKGIPPSETYLNGKIEVNQQNISVITARFKGRIEKLYVNFEGQEVTKGQKLASIYSPDLITAEKELITAKSMKATQPEYFNSAKEKLKLWGITDKQINQILKDEKPIVNFDILSPASGAVMKKNVNIGDYVQAGSALFQVANLHQLWVIFNAYQSDLASVKKGDKINFTVSALEGKVFQSKVTFINPILNDKDRTVQVRTEVENRNDLLKPGMFAQGTLKSDNKNKSGLYIPKSAVLWTGKRSIVYVKLPNEAMPTFEYREVTLGGAAGNYYIVTNGLKAGETVATKGAFKIDATAQIEGKPSMMNPETN